MISAVSGVSFRGEASTAQTTAADFQQLIQSEGKYSNKNAVATDTVEVQGQEKPAKKGKAGKIIGGTLAAVVVAGLALFGLKRGNVLKVNPEATGWFQKSLSKLAEAGEWIGTKMIDPLVNLFKGKKAQEVVEEGAEKAGEEVSKLFA